MIVSVVQPDRRHRRPGRRPKFTVDEALARRAASRRAVHRRDQRRRRAGYRVLATARRRRRGDPRRPLAARRRLDRGPAASSCRGRRHALVARDPRPRHLLGAAPRRAADQADDRDGRPRSPAATSRTACPTWRPGTEAGELGAALNTMMAKIEDAFDERTASEARLRQFVADASHELRTPVTTIRGYAELYRSGGLDDPDELAQAMRRTEQEVGPHGLARRRPAAPRPARPGPPARARRRRPRRARGRRGRATRGPSTPTARSPRRSPRASRSSATRAGCARCVANLVGNALVHTPAGHAGAGAGRPQRRSTRVLEVARRRARACPPSRRPGLRALLPRRPGPLPPRAADRASASRSCRRSSTPTAARSRSTTAPGHGHDGARRAAADGVELGRRSMPLRGPTLRARPTVPPSGTAPLHLLASPRWRNANRCSTACASTPGRPPTSPSRSPASASGSRRRLPVGPAARSCSTSSTSSTIGSGPEARRSVLLVLQGLDAAGKDGTIRHVFTGVNPQGAGHLVQGAVRVELAHDFLWRVHRVCRRGRSSGSSTGPTTRTSSRRPVLGAHRRAATRRRYAISATSSTCSATRDPRS